MPPRIRPVDMASDSTMVMAAETLADAIRTFAPYPEIAKAVYVSKVSGTDKTRNITVAVDTSKVPYARAFDTGSGLHVQKGKVKKYEIWPRNGQALAFFWPKAKPPYRRSSPPNKLLGRSKKTGKLLFRYVEHPGVRGTNYIQRAKDGARPQIKELISANASQAVKIFLRTTFQEGIKK